MSIMDQRARQGLSRPTPSEVDVKSQEQGIADIESKIIRLFYSIGVTMGRRPFQHPDLREAGPNSFNSA